jgi:hypothetical protein
MSMKQKPTAAPMPMLKNAGAAPLIYFDSIPVFGAFAGHVELELAARMLLPKPDGSVMVDMACTAHLRCSPAAAMQMIEALTKAVDMLKPQVQRTVLDMPNSAEPERSPLLNS